MKRKTQDDTRLTVIRGPARPSRCNPPREERSPGTTPRGMRWRRCPLTRSLTQIAPTRTGFGGTPAALNAQIGWIDLEISMGARKRQNRLRPSPLLLPHSRAGYQAVQHSSTSVQTPCLNPNLFSRLIGRSARQAAGISAPVEHESDSEDSDSDTHAEFVADKVEGASIGFEKLLLSVLMEWLHSGASLLSSTNSPRSCVSCSGRRHDALHHEFMGREEVAMGTLGQK
ncbi:hypothetical protein B0H13DRAFT_1866244 [Mycena leptocephala]|nr:hypothetical protein B0H13DRAFT_1866244 [Mycena leptocephala]